MLGCVCVHSERGQGLGLRLGEKSTDAELQLKTPEMQLSQWDGFFRKTAAWKEENWNLWLQFIRNEDALRHLA